MIVRSTETLCLLSFVATCRKTLSAILESHLLMVVVKNVTIFARIFDLAAAVKLAKRERDLRSASGP